MHKQVQPISVSDTALARLRHLMKEQSAAGIRIRLRARGCSGLSYVLEYIDDPIEGDIHVPLDGLSLFIQSKALLFLVGTHMDHQETPTRSGFVFTNPNEKGRCGCNASFHV